MLKEGLRARGPWCRPVFSRGLTLNERIPTHKTLLTLLSVAAISINACGQNTFDACFGREDLVLTNGKILTMDAAGRIATAMRVRGDRIMAVDEVGSIADACTRVIDLQGRTVIPGLIDSHLHLARQGNAPSYDTRQAERATTVDELLAVLQARAGSVPETSFITVIGGIELEQLRENRMASLAELDRALPSHAVYIQQGFMGPAWTNSKGKTFFEAHSVSVNDDGMFAPGDDTNAAFVAISAQQTFEDRVRGTRELMGFANSLGLTMAVDQGGTPFPGASFFDVKEDYLAIVELWRRGDMPLRVRIQHTASDRSPDRGVFEEKIENTYPLFGDDMLRFTGTGEHIVTFPIEGKVNPAYGAKVERAAMLGWSHEQHSVSNAENVQHLAMIEAANAEYSIEDLRWSLTHVFELGISGTENLIETIKSMNMGLRVQAQAYSLPTDRFPLGRTLGGENSGPLYRTLLDIGVHLGAGTDGALLGPMNPWFSLYYMVTGKDNMGRLVNPGQALTREEALALYTVNNAWFSFDEDALGSIEVGKLADLAVLSDDYLEVPEEEILGLRSVLTIVGGEIVYVGEGFLGLAPDND